MYWTKDICQAYFSHCFPAFDEHPFPVKNGFWLVRLSLGELLRLSKVPVSVHAALAFLRGKQRCGGSRLIIIIILFFWFFFCVCVLLCVC